MDNQNFDAVYEKYGKCYTELLFYLGNSSDTEWRLTVIFNEVIAKKMPFLG